MQEKYGRMRMIRELWMVYSLSGAIITIIAFVSRWYAMTNRDIKENTKAIERVDRESKNGDNRLCRWKDDLAESINNVALEMAEIKGGVTEMGKSLDRWMTKNGK